MDKTHELKKLIAQTSLPITTIEFNSDYTDVELFYKGNSIGFIPTTQTETDGETIYKYDTSESQLRRLDWLQIFTDKKSELTLLIRHLLKNNTLEIDANRRTICKFDVIAIGEEQFSSEYAFKFENDAFRVFPS